MSDFTRLVDLAWQEGFLVAQGSALINTSLRLGELQPNERWDVDLSVPRLTWTEGSALLFGGPCQLLGTFVEGDGFLWGHFNPSVSETGWRDVHDRLQTLPDVAPLLTTRAFAVSRAEASLVMQWLAVKTDFTGCFEAPVGQATGYLAVTLNEGTGCRGWCAWCGSLSHQVQRLIAGPRRVMICDRCGALLGDILAESDREDLPVDPPKRWGTPTLQYCVFCESQRTSLILGNFAGICRGCAKRVVEVVTAP